MNEMIAQLLSLARWETGAGDAQRERIDFCALVREVIDDADFEARGHNRAVRIIECAACEITGTRSLLRSAVENVVRNAVRHTPEGTAVSVSLRREKRAGNELAVLSVRDEGAGVQLRDLVLDAVDGHGTGARAWRGGCWGGFDSRRLGLMRLARGQSSTYDRYHCFSLLCWFMRSLRRRGRRLGFCGRRVVVM